jgi:ribosome-associated protein
MSKNNLDNCKNNILINLEDSKAKDIVTINLTNKNDICDYMVITSGTSNRHAKSISNKLIHAIKHDEKFSDISAYNVEGDDEGEWIVIDAFSIVIHIFQPEFRELYKLEELWSN